MPKSKFAKVLKNRDKYFKKISKDKRVLTGAVMLLVFVLLYFLKGFYIAAVVNGQPISRFSVIGELERRGGSQALDSLINQTLILQEAKKQNVTTTDQEIND